MVSELSKLVDTARQLLHCADNRKIFLFEGPLGSGKTTLIKALCAVLQVVDVVNSPTFTLINEYHSKDQGSVYHFDCYRIHHIDTAIALDFEAYFISGHYCFIEWPSKIRALLPLHYFLINIEMASPTSRNLIYSSY